MPSISLRHVSKRYCGNLQAADVLSDFSLDIADGEFVALMGPPGTGKTTILNLIAGIDRPDHGEIIVGGKHVEQMLRGRLARWRAHHVGIVSQSYDLLPMLTAAQNVELPLLSKRQTRAERALRVAEALNRVALADRAEHKPGQLTSGQQQRVAIARAVISEPSLLLCDEPAGDFHRENSGIIVSLLRSLNREKGMTILAVTCSRHAAVCTDRILRLEGNNRLAAA
jgi:putative ABC transport system ATP-binding protein